jgi:hypothetical protein
MQRGIEKGKGRKRLLLRSKGCLDGGVDKVLSGGELDAVLPLKILSDGLLGDLREVGLGEQSLDGRFEFLVRRRRSNAERSGRGEAAEEVRGWTRSRSG